MDKSKWKSTFSYTIHGYVWNNIIGLFVKEEDFYLILLFVTKEIFQDIVE